MIRSSALVIAIQGALLAAGAATNPAMAQAGGTQPVQQAGSPTAAKRFTLELSAGAGFTSVNKDKWAGGTLTDWAQALYQGEARLFFAERGRMQLGVEAGYHYFWYYEILYAGNYISYDVAATRLGGVARLPLMNRLSADLGAALYMFDGYTDPGLSGALVFMLPAGNLKLPLHLRTDLVLDSDAMLIGSGATLGIAIKF